MKSWASSGIFAATRREALVRGALAVLLLGAVLWLPVGFAIAVLISSALSGIFGIALYRYALDGEAVGGFTPEELESAVRTKGSHGRNAPPTATPGTV